MELHNPEKLNLPALKIQKNLDREKIENDECVKNIINSKILLDTGLNSLFVRILRYTKEINDLLEKKNKLINYDSDYQQMRYNLYHIFKREGRND